MAVALSATVPAPITLAVALDAARATLAELLGIRTVRSDAATHQLLDDLTGRGSPAPRVSGSLQLDASTGTRPAQCR